ncbi:MAG: GNAT family N-acetyltransferase [Deltaproteobacteria bacterium]|nr:GNAT family N-acetyltransferase [Deltaproteobacteria bacterium]
MNVEKPDTTRHTRRSYDFDWREKFSAQVATSAEAVARIRPGQRIFIGTGCAQPQELVRALVERSDDLPDCEIVHLLTMGDAPYAEESLRNSFRVNSFFIADNVRTAIQEGIGSYTPIFLSDIPRLFKSRQLPLDVALVQVSPPDRHGRLSLGISVDIVKSALESAALVIAQVNPQMPRTHGDSFLGVEDLDVLVPVDTPILENPPPEPTEVTRQIGQYIAALVENGSTLELGIGGIPHALIEFLKNKKDLGIHTEMFTDSIIELVESGVINGSHKTHDRGKIVASFCIGTNALYDFIDDNPIFSFHPTEYVNDPFLISQQRRMVAINVALEVDLTGQVCADSLGDKFFSGIGGQVDFNRGAARAPGGKAIIAMPSTAKDGKISRIVTRLSPGAGVVTSRGDVHYVVTEHGVAYLHGKSVESRALALIAVAHPDFRADLLREAIENKLLHKSLADVEGRIFVGPEDLKTSTLLKDGTKVSVRPVHPTEEQKMKEFLYALSKKSVYFRFMSNLKRFSHQQVKNFVYIDHRSEVSVVATVPDADGEEFIGTGGYFLNPTTNRAETAFAVRDDWHNRGIGSFLLMHLVQIARRNGIAGFTAEVLRANKGMLYVLEKSGCTVHTRPEGDVFVLDIEFPQT